MFDVGFPELFIVAVLAIIVIGPKDLPNAIRSVMGVVRKVREMGSEFKTGMKKMADEVELDAITRKLNEAGNISIEDNKPATNSSSDFSDYQEFDYDEYDYDRGTKNTTPSTDGSDSSKEDKNDVEPSVDTISETSETVTPEKTNNTKKQAAEGKADD